MYQQLFGRCNYESLNRLPYTLFHDTESDDKSLNDKLVSLSMVRNISISNRLNIWYDKCRSKCPMYPCYYTYCITNGHSDSSIKVGGKKLGSSIRVESPGHTNSYINYFAKVNLLVFIVYILSSLGTWFGLFIISSNPLIIIKIIIKTIIKIIIKIMQFITDNNIKRKRKYCKRNIHLRKEANVSISQYLFDHRHDKWNN